MGGIRKTVNTKHLRTLQIAPPTHSKYGLPMHTYIGNMFCTHLSVQVKSLGIQDQPFFYCHLKNGRYKKNSKYLAPVTILQPIKKKSTPSYCKY